MGVYIGGSINRQANLDELKKHKELSIFSELEFSDARKSYYSST